MLWFIKTAKEYNLYRNNIQDTECSEPDSLRGRSFSSLKLEELIDIIDCKEIDEKFGNCSCSYYDLEKQLTLSCSNVNNPEIQVFKTPPLIYKVVLILQNSNLTSVPGGLPKNISELHLAYNNISYIPALPDTLTVSIFIFRHID